MNAVRKNRSLARLLRKEFGQFLGQGRCSLREIGTTDRRSKLFMVKSGRKVFYVRSGAAVKKIAQTAFFLWRNGFDRPPLTMPQPLEYKRGRFVYLAYPGRRVRDVMERSRGGKPVLINHLDRCLIRPGLSFGALANVIRLTACWLAKLHALGPGPGFQKGIRHHHNLAVVFRKSLHRAYSRNNRERLEDLNKILDKLVEDINFLVSRLNQNHQWVLIHGDTNLNNIITNKKGDEIGLIDFSESCNYDALYDVAMMLVHLEVALQPYYRRPQISRLKKIFARTHLQSSRRFSAGWFDCLSDEDYHWRLGLHRTWSAMQFLQFTLANFPLRREGWPVYIDWLEQKLIKIAQEVY